jgi:hypothetical protein
MKTSIIALAAFSSLLAAPVPARAESNPVSQVEVTYVSPEKFSDFKDSSMNTEKGREYLAAEFTKHIRRVAKEVLPAGDRLEVRFTDINLAGEYEPQHGPQYDDIRIMREIYPPRMRLDFRLLGADGKVVAEGARNLIDMNYQSNGRTFDDDPLRYDKQLLTDWLHSEFRKKA